MNDLTNRIASSEYKSAPLVAAFTGKSVFRSGSAIVWYLYLIGRRRRRRKELANPLCSKCVRGISLQRVVLARKPPAHSRIFQVAEIFNRERAPSNDYDDLVRIQNGRTGRFRRRKAASTGREPKRRFFKRQRISQAFPVNGPMGLDEAR